MTQPRTPPRRWRTERAAAIAVTVMVATVAIWVFPLGASASATPAGAGSTSIVWAYGGIDSYNISSQGARGMYVGNATDGFSVILTQANTSATTFVLAENFTIGARMNLTYCRPNCADPNLLEHYAYSEWESSLDVANFTTGAAVALHNSTIAPAVGILSSNASVASNVSSTLTATRNGTTHLVQELFASASARLALDFTPALGLFPENLTSAATWISTAAFAASGAWQTDYLAVEPPVQKGPDPSSGTLTGSGTASLGGTDRGGLRLSDRSLTQVALKLTVLGSGTAGFNAGFDLMDGFAIVPHAANLLESSATAAWRVGAAANTTFEAVGADIGLTPGRGLGFVASAWSYSTAITNPDPSSSGGSHTVQGAPLPPAEAGSTANCLRAATDCSNAGSVATTPNAVSTSITPLLFVVAGTVALVAIVGGLLISQRRRIPPPSYPNASLYPPGNSRPAQARKAPATPTDPDEEDPLGNLW